MKNVLNYIAKSNTPALEETAELIDVLNGTTYDEVGLTLEEIKEYLRKNSRLTKVQINELFSINKFNSNPNMTYKLAECAEGTADFADYVTENIEPEGDIFAWNDDGEDDIDYSACSFTTNNLFIVWGGSCMGDDDSILIVSESF